MYNNAYLGQAAKADQVEYAYLGVNEVAKRIRRAYIGDENGKAKLCYEEWNWRPSYGSFGYTSATVTFGKYNVDDVWTPCYMPDSAVIRYLIFRRISSEYTYADYINSGATPVRNVIMTKDSSTVGGYLAYYDRLSSGDYDMFAIADGYEIIN